MSGSISTPSDISLAVRVPRELPHSLEAEQAVLGALLIDERAFSLVRDRLSSNDFYLCAHQLIYAACAELSENGQPLDPVLVHQLLEGKGLLGTAVPRDLPFALAKSLGTAANVEHYARTVIDLADVRRIQCAAQEVLSRGYQAGADVPSYLAESNRSLLAILERRPATTRLKERIRPVGLSWLDTRPAPLPCLLRYGDRGFLPRGLVGMVAGAGGLGKTFALVDLALAVATGGGWLGTFQSERPGRVLLLLGEEDQAEVRRRVYYAAQARGMDDRDRELIASNLYALGMRGESVALIRSAHEVTAARGDMASIHDVETDFARDLRTILEERGPWDLVVLDPVSRLAASDTEIDNSAATRFIECLERLARVPGAPFLMVAHHTSQSSRQTILAGGSSDATAARGVTGLTDGPRWTAVLEPVTAPTKPPTVLKGLLRLREVKRNSTEEIEPVYVKRGEEGALFPASAEEVESYRQEARRSAERDNGVSATPSANGSPTKKGCGYHFEAPNRKDWE
ncbi:MAG TPA: AAA family ATPase [Anaeromyxobacteraceae bacterium]|nr:AAA family ATPase [Anaeromyxobacteraceae bacterium]